MSTVVTAAREAISYFLSDADNAEIIRHIESRLGISKKYIENSYCRYAMDSLTSSNEIYNDVGIHVAMWIEYQAQNGLHEKRQFVVLNELERWQPKTILISHQAQPRPWQRISVAQTVSEAIVYLQIECGAVVLR